MKISDISRILKVKHSLFACSEIEASKLFLDGLKHKLNEAFKVHFIFCAFEKFSSIFSSLAFLTHLAYFLQEENCFVVQGYAQHGDFRRI